MASQINASQVTNVIQLISQLNGLNQNIVSGNAANDPNVAKSLQTITSLFQTLQPTETGSSTATGYISKANASKLGYLILGTTALAVIGNLVIGSFNASSSASNSPTGTQASPSLTSSTSGVSFASSIFGVLSIGFSLFTSYLNKNDQQVVKQVQDSVAHAQQNLAPLIESLSQMNAPNSTTSVQDILKILSNIPPHPTIDVSQDHWISSILRALPIENPMRIRFDALCNLAKEVLVKSNSEKINQLSEDFVTFEQTTGIILNKIYIDNISFNVAGKVELVGPSNNNGKSEV